MPSTESAWSCAKWLLSMPWHGRAGRAGRTASRADEAGASGIHLVRAHSSSRQHATLPKHGDDGPGARRRLRVLWVCTTARPSCEHSDTERAMKAAAPPRGRGHRLQGTVHPVQNRMINSTNNIVRSRSFESVPASHDVNQRLPDEFKRLPGVCAYGETDDARRNSPSCVKTACLSGVSPRLGNPKAGWSSSHEHQ
jgi:hypothetical protein